MNQAEPKAVGTLDSPPVGEAVAPSPPPTPASIHHASPMSRELDLNHDHDDALPQFHRVDNILGPAVVLGLAQHALQQEMHVVSAEEPSSFVEAASNPSQRVAMVEELKSNEDNKTWDVVDLSHGH
jgi:hypothetical protein